MQVMANWNNNNNDHHQNNHHHDHDLDHDDDNYYYYNMMNVTDNLRWNTMITNIRVHETIKYIPQFFFRGCSKLCTIHFPTTTTRTNYYFAKLDKGCFSDCISLLIIHNLPKTIYSIGDWCFYNSGIQQIYIPTRVLYIGQGVFARCQSLKYITLHEDIQTIKRYAFYGCLELKRIQLIYNNNNNNNNNNDNNNIDNNNNNTPSLKDIGSFAFSGCGLEEIELPMNINLDERSFERCNHLTTIILPTIMGRIGKFTFLGCTNIHTMYLRKDNDINNNKNNNNNNQKNVQQQQQQPFSTTVEFILLIELCRNDGLSAVDRIGLGWTIMNDDEKNDDERDIKSTVQISCLFSLIKRNCHALVLVKKK